jgi:CRISPR/Cas system-associated protein Cas10 (large subunit of type III CRISPR-Cas system)
MSNYEPPFSAYFALVRGDADFMGALLSGDVKMAYRTSFSDLFMKAIQSTNAYTHDELKIIHNEIKKHELQLEKEKLKLVWPLYHTAISRALILSAIRDIEILYEVFGESGLPIYAGGDDLLAIISPIHAFRLVQHTREAFSNGDGHHFHIVYFDGIPSAYLPAMGLASRSYSITFRHYKYPLSISLESSVEDIDEYSKKSVFKRNVEKWNKDAVTLSYMPRGGGKLTRAVLPLTFPSVLSTSFLNVLPDILFHVLHNSLSASFIYDLTSMHENYDSVAYETNTLESYWKQAERIVKRNLTVRTMDSKLAEAVRDWLAESLSEKFKPLFGVTVLFNDSPRTIAYELSHALWCIMSAIRVKEA